MLKRHLFCGLLLLAIAVMPGPAGAKQELNVAVAANFAPVMELIGRDFESETGIPVRLTISSSGRLLTQIQNGAPFDLYFSADAERPEILHSEGLCAQPQSYATGRTVLWSSDPELCSVADWKKAVSRPEVEKIAIANPATAPYGTAARDACLQLKNWPAVEKKFVYGTNVGQAFQYAQAGVAQVAFVALSFALSEQGEKGCFLELEESDPVEQKACVTAYGQNNPGAERFLRNATSGETVQVKEKYGYL